MYMYLCIHVHDDRHPPLHQVFQYDGSQRCNVAEFAVFAIISLILVASFVLPAPFAIAYICHKRPQVSQSVLHYWPLMYMYV